MFAPQCERLNLRFRVLPQNKQFGFFPFLTWHQIVFCGSKKILNADYLVDDNPINFEGFVGQGLLYTAHHNLNETRFPRVNNWAEVLEALGMNTK